MGVHECNVSRLVAAYAHSVDNLAIGRKRGMVRMVSIDSKYFLQGEIILVSVPSHFPCLRLQHRLYVLHCNFDRMHVGLLCYL